MLNSIKRILLSKKGEKVYVFDDHAFETRAKSQKRLRTKFYPNKLKKDVTSMLERLIISKNVMELYIQLRIHIFSLMQV
jgi:hypothetical protein